MHSGLSKKKYKSYLLNVSDLDIPVRIYKERRNSIRASLGKDHAILRLPFLISKSGEKEQIDRFYNWLQDKVLSQERFRSKFLSKKYKDGYAFQLFDKAFQLKIEQTENKSHSAKYMGEGIIKIRLAGNTNIEASGNEITNLISRVIAQLYKREMTERVHHFNDLYFNKNIKDVKLKYNKSNWGSCSSSSNINLSTRLLFAPKPVQDYVIVHELAHLIEMNHSTRYWALVEEAMPDYKTYEKWLKVNGYQCDFGL
jgi:predicted metal-dependent hydrolase